MERKRGKNQRDSVSYLIDFGPKKIKRGLGLTKTKLSFFVWFESRGNPLSI
jgi:hypothetical protein